MVAPLARALVVGVILSGIVACDRTAPSAGGGGPITSTGARRSCATVADCGGEEVCWFDAPGCGPGVRGTCGPQDPPCVVAHPFCSCAGRTYYGCSRPPAAFSRKGECGDAGR